ncbi:HlyD family secretion protein [Rhizobium sp. LjRoot30]|uniref:HlyD family secretion protein n=1 Tax=Rhizobium sp. LjRoot30 TaxID=3342320 RepID=UPI003ECDAE1A
MLKLFRSPSTLVTLLAGLAGVLLVLYAWRLPPFLTSVETTENAYVRGYVTTISPQVSGYIVEVPVKDYAEVKQGDVLVRIDDRSYTQKVAQARATLQAQQASLANSHQQELSAQANIHAAEAEVESAESVLNQAELTSRRVANLTDRGVASTSESEKAAAAQLQAKAGLNRAKAAVEVARQSLATIIVSRAALEANVTGAEAAVQLADIDLQNTVIVAPRDGRLGEIGARLGQYVTPGTQLLAVVPRDVWVVANFKETQLYGMQIGQPVTIVVDALNKRTIKGHIQNFSPATGSEFSVIKPDNASGNFTKIAQRVGVRISIDKDQAPIEHLGPGLSVVVSIDKSSAPQTGEDLLSLY